MIYSCVITFPTTFYAIKAEEALRHIQISFKMVPVPRIISSSCGTALRCACEDLELIRNTLLEQSIALESFYRLAEQGLKTPTAEELMFNE